MLYKLPAFNYLLIRALLISFFAFLTKPVFSQLIPKNFSSINVNDGLSQNSIWGIKQDHKGFLWIGTADGLNRYDGNSIKIFKPNPKDANSIKGNTSYFFLEDSRQNLWITHERGIEIYNPLKENFQHVFTYAQVPSTDVNNAPIGEYPKGKIWMWISARGLMEIDQDTRKILHIYQPPKDFDFPLASACSYATIDKNGLAWFTTLDKRVISFDLNAKKFRKSYFIGKRTGGLLQLNDSVIIIGIEGGIIFLNTKTDETVFESFDKYFSKELTKEDLVFSILKYDNKYLWLGTNAGLLIYDLQKHEYIAHVKSFEEGRQTSYNYIQTIYRDRSGNVWFGTNGDGLKKYAPGMNKFGHLYNPEAKSNLVKCIYAKDNGYVYTGMYDNGIQYFSPDGKLVKQYDINNSNIPENSVLSIQPLNENEYLLSHGLKISLFNESTGQFLDITPQLKKDLALNDKTITFPYFYRKKDGSLLFTYGDLIISFSKKLNGKLQTKIVKQYKDKKISYLYFDAQDNLHASYIRGIFAEKNGQYKEVKLPLETLVKSMCKDRKGNLWVATIRGLFKYNKDLKLLASFDENNGLINNFIYGLLTDENGNIWFSHNKGLSRLNPEKNTFRHYTIDDGLQSSEFNTGAFFKRKDGKLFFGGVNGTNCFFADQIKNNPVKPNTVITKILLFDKLLQTNASFTSHKNIKLSYDQNILSFDFAALELTNPTKNQYAYKMKGLDPDWTYAGNKHFARYNLPPGNYVFEVRASNNDGIWNINPTKLHITITPPYWQTAWFRILVILSGVLALAAVFMLYYRQRYKEQIRELEIQKKMQDERQRISRDLHDHVGTQVSYIVSNIDWLTDPVKPSMQTEKENRLDNIRSAAKNVMSSLRETIWAVRQEEVNIEEFADRFTLFARNLVKDSAIDLQLEVSIAKPSILSPIQALNLYRICQESFSNAVKHASATKIECVIKADEKYMFYMSVKDNGKGFEANSASPKGHYGLENMYFRATELGAEFKITSAKNEGTLVELFLKR